MAWVRHHDRYDGAAVDPKAKYVEPKSSELPDANRHGQIELTHHP